ncbi:MAG: biotin--[acetyl-CoA-carboxylase] ligase [Lachnospiraceae bacterium]|nr:biotin--[acetyl-CoA-carboxylase] ligase [Lachnospiraceae bacterium]
MKAKILKLLQEASDRYISGQSLCETLGVTRQAVWKNIGQLKEMGYEIVSVSGKGYRLVSTPDRLYAPEIQSFLPEDGFCQKVECHDEIDSTNLRAKQLAELGEPEGMLVVADKQTAGRGRRGRGWTSEAGVGIYMSYILRPSLPPSKVSGVTLVTALAMCQAISQVCGVQPLIKWPNDVILDGKKVCGILTEMSSEIQYVHYAVTGIGVNANQTEFAEDIREHATSIYLQTGKRVPRAELTAAFAKSFGEYYAVFERDGNLRSLVEEYDHILANRDKEVLVYHGMVEDAKPEDIARGIARGINEDGSLLVEIDGTLQAVRSGEVSIRGVNGYVE